MNRKKNILIVMSSPFKSGLAPENYIRAKALFGNDKNQIDIICFPIGEDISASNIRIIRVPKKNCFGNFQVGQYYKILLFTILMIFKLIFKRDKKYDFIFLFNASYLFFWILRPLYKGKTITMVYAPLAGELIKWNISSNRILFKLVENFERFVLSKYDKIIVNMDHLKKHYEDAGFNTNNMVVIPHAYDSNMVHYSDRYNDGSFKILYAGSFVKIQNLSLIYDIANLLRSNKNIQFILIGATSVEYDAEYETIKRLDLDNVQIHKRKNQADLQEFYINADVLISSRTDGSDLPFKIIEYMSWGKCILATDRPIHNLVLNKEISCLVEPDAHIISQEILRLYNNPELILQYQRKVIQYFNKFHSFDSMKARYDDLLTEYLPELS
jgi:glycosyltransferase involved in cell wall biosynthesis